MAGWDGFYASYMTGSEGQGFAMFIFFGGKIVGADPLGVQFDGTYTASDDGSIDGVVTVKVPSGRTVIQGASAGPTGMTYDIPIKFGAQDFNLDYIKLETPLGQINIKMNKIRDI
ncbi:hypothetical protein [Sphingomonas sp. IC081]|uniref:hypothetical protein n=1 Tax=Sphingomonas sp. IC081 TaxID=304378 RepID=UPI00115875F9|nr:hypothetical protein [Sphingomonas sp. IC081]QDK34748.1 hypothetical protein DM450_0025 [Sphingomonas sp. IC081]